MVKFPAELIDEVATCKVVPSYISNLVGLKLERIAPLNFRSLNLIGVKDGIGVTLPGLLPAMNVSAPIEGSDSSVCAEAEEVCFSVELITSTVLVDVLVSSLSEKLRTSPAAALTWASGSQIPPVLPRQKNAAASDRNSEPLLQLTSKVNLMEPDEAPPRLMKADMKGDPVAGQVIVGTLREPVKRVIPVEEVAL